MTALEIKKFLKRSYAFRTQSIFIPEYTYGDLRIDAIVVDTARRWIRGFEIKTSRSDFLQDDKWVLYSEFCSSLSVVCPEGVVRPEEIKKPFGLLWILHKTDAYNPRNLIWKKKPLNFQKRQSLSWFWTYTNVLEKEILRLDREAGLLRERVGRLDRIEE